MVVKDSWHSREYPVLEAIVEICNDELYPMVQLNNVAEKCGLPILEVGLAARALGDAGYIDLNITMTGGDPGPWFVTSISPEARQATGAWPTPENIAERLFAELEVQQKLEQDPAKKQWIMRVLGGTGEIAKETGIEVIASVLAKIATGGAVGI